MGSEFKEKREPEADEYPVWVKISALLGFPLLVSYVFWPNYLLMGAGMILLSAAGFGMQKSGGKKITLVGAILPLVLFLGGVWAVVSYLFSL